MGELTKIKDVSMKYAVTARTLRYYEDMGILTSVRSEGYAHRLYDEAAITRLKQILILRKLNISVRDIKRIFKASGSEVVLEVLGKKAEEIDDEVALLHELKEIVLEFIRQIKQSDFHNDADVKQLYDKAKEIETQLTVHDYKGNPSNVNRLLEVTEKLEDTRITMPAAIRAYKQSVGPMRYIGKKYAAPEEAWGDFDDHHSENLIKLMGINLKDLYEDGDALVALMSMRDGSHDSFEYWLGYFVPPNTPVPEGFEYEDFSYPAIGTCWLYGKDGEVYGIESMAYERLKEEGFEVATTDWWFERYIWSRSEADSKGTVIIDICFFLKN